MNAQNHWARRGPAGGGGRHVNPRMVAGHKLQSTKTNKELVAVGAPADDDDDEWIECLEDVFA